MRFFTVASLLGLLTFSSAAPAPVPQVPAGPGVVTPSVRSQYEVWTGAIHYKTAAGKIFKNGITTDITTLVTFNFPPESVGKTCEFHFYLSTTSTVTGSGLFDVFTSLAPATGDTTSWPPGNQRNNHVGRLSAVLGGEATFVSGFPNTILSFPCPAGTWAAEFVGVYDSDDIEWTGTGVGSYFKFS
jgi:Ubiquitin 3 binding protein But2 C-terminal domain